MRTTSALFRSAAYRVVTARDGLAGWPAGRRAFRDLGMMDPKRQESFVAERLANILLHAYRTVPYYRRRWNEIGFVPTPDVSAHDLVRLPLLTKEDIRERKEELISERYDKTALDIDYTGGTTGTHVSFYRDRPCGVERLGRQWGVLERCGYRPGDRRGLVWGVHEDLPAGAGHTLGAFVRRIAGAQEVLCCTHMRRAQLSEYYERIATFRPKVLYGYPNAIHEFACFIADTGRRPISVDRVLCTAEVLTESQRRTFESHFGAEVYNLYCSREHGCVAFECSRHKGLHVDVGNVYVEVIHDGRPALPGESGEIVITDLLNYGMPFVRHATADVATVSRHDCECGLALPLLESFDGRVTDMLFRPDGTVVAGVMLVDLFLDVDAIRAVQFVQTTLETLEVRMVLADTGLPADTRERVMKELREVMGEQIEIALRVVPEIPRSPQSGKYQEVICRIDRPAPRTQGAWPVCPPTS